MKWPLLCLRVCVHGCVIWAGVGSQFLAIVSGILLMALLGMFNVHRHGSINAAAILLYAFTSCELDILTILSPFVSLPD